MRWLILIFSLAFLSSAAQDRLFYKNGKIKATHLVSVGKDFIFYRNSDTSIVSKVPKADLLMVEDIRGVRYIFSSTTGGPSSEKKQALSLPLQRNIFSLQPLGLLVGRGTLVYERLNKTGFVGFVFPLSITFDPIGPIYSVPADTGAARIQRISGINFIVGADVNFYLHEDADNTFFCGPRFRYGTDVFLRNLEGYSFQTQFGWRVSGLGDRFVQHISMGFGFARVNSLMVKRVADPRRSYAWISINYRLGIRW